MKKLLTATALMLGLAACGQYANDAGTTCAVTGFNRDGGMHEITWDGPATLCVIAYEDGVMTTGTNYAPVRSDAPISWTRAEDGQ